MLFDMSEYVPAVNKSDIRQILNHTRMGLVKSNVSDIIAVATHALDPN